METLEKMRRQGGIIIMTVFMGAMLALLVFVTGRWVAGLWLYGGAILAAAGFFLVGVGRANRLGDDD